MRSKYNVSIDKSTRTMDGIVFHSEAEMNRYFWLKKMEQQGMIEDLFLQPKFVLLDGFTYEGKRYRAITYKADFKYKQNGRTVIEDVKGYETKTFAIKKKMFLSKYGAYYKFQIIKP